MPRTPAGLTLLVALVSSSAPHLAHAEEPDFEALAAELARLRTEVESLSEQIEDKREDTRARIRTLAAQKSNLEAEAQREELRLEQLQQSLEKVQTRVREASQAQRELKPAFLAAADAVAAAVQAGLPFKTDSRTQDILQLRKDVEEDVVAPTTAVSRLWSRVEDEVRLGRENGLYQQIISLDGQEILADVARVGMVMLFFRTESGRYGKAERSGEGWRYVAITEPEEVKRLEAFFQSLERRVRVGFFELPNALPKAGGAR
jgi:hypothetical protein